MEEVSKVSERMAITSFERGPFRFHRRDDVVERSIIRERLNRYEANDCTAGRVRIVHLYITEVQPHAQIATVLMGGMREAAYWWCSEDPERIYQSETLEAAAIALDQAHGYGRATCAANRQRDIRQWHEKHGGAAAPGAIHQW